MYLHIHTDCEYFAGCERLLPIIWNSKEITDTFQITFTYRKSRRYQIELDKFLPNSITAIAIFDSFLLRQFPFRSKIFRRRVFYNFFYFLDEVFSIVFLYPLFFYELTKLTYVFFKDRPDVLHINNGGYPGARSARAAACAAKICGIPRILMVVNNLAVPKNSLVRALDYPIDFMVRRCTNIFITASTQANDAIINTLRLERKMGQKIPNATAAPQIFESRASIRKTMRCDPTTIVIGVVASLEKRKGHEVLLKALAIIVADKPLLARRLNVWIIGDGPLALSLEDTSRNLGIGKITQFLGYKYDYQDFISAMDIMVLCSVSNEDSPLATIEAMSLSVPLIVSDFAGLSDQVVDEESGFLFPVGDSEALSKALIKLIENENLRINMGHAGYARYQRHYSPNRFSADYMKLYLGT